ncbi:hypothetical protein KSD_57120 [Ktedonobacter sp. SOSP1-85]|nr:hypothetical protein KSD_57120 [Ktedonobacter sp. SOSP1-85]
MLLLQAMTSSEMLVWLLALANGCAVPGDRFRQEKDDLITTSQPGSLSQKSYAVSFWR